MWNNLSMTEKAQLMKEMVSNGVTDLNSITGLYNKFSDGGYIDWLSELIKWRPGIEADVYNSNSAYDYQGFYNEDPKRAWDMLNGNPEAHFTDKYKRPNHPTFSDESIYSTPETPGGHWHENYGGGSRWVYEPSDYTKRNREETLKYLENSGEGYLDGMNVVFPSRKYDEGGYFKNGIKKSDVFPTKNQQVADMGFGNVPLNKVPKDVLNRVTFYDENDGNKIDVNKMSQEDFNKSNAVVNLASGEFIDPARIEKGDDGNALYLSTTNEPTVRPYYGYKIAQQPYYDQFRNYKIPVKNTDEAINNATNNLGMKGVEVTPFEDGEYFESPQLIGEDNWEDPLDNAGNWALLGGTSAARKGLGKYLWNPTVNFLKSFAPGTKGGYMVGTAAKDIAVAEGLINLQRLLFGNSAGDYIYNKAYNFENNYDNWFTRNRVLSTAADFFGRPEYYPINVLAKPVEYGVENISRYINSIPKQYDPIRNILELGMYSGSSSPTIQGTFKNILKVGREHPEIKPAPLKYLFTFNPEKKMKIANQVMDAFNYNGLRSADPIQFPVSKAGFNPIRAGLYGEFGSMSPYIRDIRPSDIHYNWSRKHNPNIKVVDAPYESPHLDTLWGKPENKVQTNDEGLFPINFPYDFDAGGHAFKYLPESIQVSDVYKFNPSDYMKKWVNPQTKNIALRFLNKSVLGAIDRRFTDFVFQLQPTPYYTATPSSPTLPPPPSSISFARGGKLNRGSEVWDYVETLANNLKSGILPTKITNIGMDMNGQLYYKGRKLSTNKKK